MNESHLVGFIIGTVVGLVIGFIVAYYELENRLKVALDNNDKFKVRLEMIREAFMKWHSHNSNCAWYSADSQGLCNCGLYAYFQSMGWRK